MAQNTISWRTVSTIVAVPGLLAEVESGERDGCDGYVSACFGDPGSHAAREIARGPVVGITTTSDNAATARSHRSLHVSLPLRFAAEHLPLGVCCVG